MTGFPSLIIHIFKVEGMDVTGNVAEKREADIDKEIRTAAGDEKDAYRWDWVFC